jgi:POT family proton-dependent oligopeptide transporter
MRALLVLFLISAIGLGGWDWTRAEALALYGTYTALVYLTPILGGYLADKYIGYRRAVVIGAVIMTLGHASMAMESNHIFLYIGIALLIVGNGFFKPNMTSIISHMYKDTPEKKDGAYTIFYMGVNAGAFLGIMLCGYLGETMGWGYGFGLAGIFMLLGMLQFYFAQNIFGDIGKKPERTEVQEPKMEFEGDRLNPFNIVHKIMIAIAALIGLIWIINDPLDKIANINLLKIGDVDISNIFILHGVGIFIILLILRIIRYPKITRDRMIAIVLFAVFTVIFWASFEQAGGSMTIFANDYTNRSFAGTGATAFIIVDIIITVVPIAIISWVLIKLFKQTFKKYALSNLILGFSFVVIWGIVFWKIDRNLNSSSFIVEYQVHQVMETGEDGKDKLVDKFVTDDMNMEDLAEYKTVQMTIVQPIEFTDGQEIFLIDSDKRGKLKYLREDLEGRVENDRKITATVVQKKGNEVEIPATWFLILNSLFIIIFAPFFSKWWESKYNPSGATKYGLGLILLGIGFAALAFGSVSIEKGAATASVSLIWLVIAYLFHTLGELCLSPVALSYISKLVPGRMIALMFGIWYIAIAIGNKTAGKMGGMIDEIANEHSLTYFFLIFTLIPIGLGCIAIILNPLFKKLMHGVK